VKHRQRCDKRFFFEELRGCESFVLD